MPTILGIDPGSRITGYGVITSGEGQPRYVACGCIRVTANDLHSRLQEIFSGISTVMQEYQPQHAAIEQIFMHRNPGGALKLGQARGAAIVATNGIDLAEYSARQVKQAVVGYGAATKEQVQHMVQQLLGLTQSPQADAADALAVALCHASTQRGLRAIPQARAIRRGRLR